MKSRSILVLVLMAVCLSLVLVGCLTRPDPEEKQIVVDVPDPPPNDPPPDPPPPPQSGVDPGSTSFSLPSIAERVLAGEYGLELRELLANEVATCIEEMREENLLTTSTDNVIVKIGITGKEGSRIVYDDSYLAMDIINGAYGYTARTNLHSFLRSFEGETKLK